MRKRLPIGLFPGKNRCAAVWLTIITGTFSRTSPDSSCTNSSNPPSLIDVGLRQERYDRLILFSPQFCAMACHLVPPVLYGQPIAI